MFWHICQHRLHDVWLSENHCKTLTIALMSNPSHLRELHLSSINLEDSAETLFASLGQPNCRLETLRLVKGICCYFWRSFNSFNYKVQTITLTINYKSTYNNGKPYTKVQQCNNLHLNIAPVSLIWCPKLDNWKYEGDRRSVLLSRVNE